MKVLAFLLIITIASAYEHPVRSPAQQWPNCPCGRSYFPICASDGQTYSNRCLFNCRADHLSKHGEHLAIVKYSPCDEKE